MLSRRLIRLAQAPRASVARVTAVRFYNPDQKGDVQDQASQAGYASKNPKYAAPVDAASPETGKKASHDHIGNKEGVGFAEQVGSASTAFGGQHQPESHEGRSGREDITPPSAADAIKSKLGFKTTSGEAKQNRGGGVGVTGTGNVTVDRGKRTFHSSATARMPDQTKGQAPEASRQPKDNTRGDQNGHLKHKAASSQPDSGKGNAAEEPHLPSHVCLSHVAISGGRALTLDWF